MSKKKWIGPILFVLSVIIFNNVFGNKTLFWLLALRSHLVDKGVVTFHNVSRKLPLRWWIWRQNEMEIVFAAVPWDLGDDYPMFFLSQSVMTEEELKNQYDGRTLIIQGKPVEFVSYKTATIGKENAFGVRHINKKDKKIFERWTIPSKGLTITIPDLSEKWYPYVWEFISSEEWSFKEVKGGN